MRLRTVCTLAVVVTAALAINSVMAQSTATGTDRAGAARQPAAQPSQSPSSQTSRPDGAQAAALGTLSAINTGEISTGRLAVAQATDARTKRYAQRMIDEHTTNNQQLAKWTADASAPPARAKMEDGKKTLAMLQQAKGPAFDGAYLQAMVRDHQAALQALDSTLIPAAKEAEVAAFLRSTRGHVAAHLKDAQELLAQMDGSGAGARQGGTR